MAEGVFVSYCHQQGEWVWDRLLPLLEAGGATVHIDREQFTAGKALVPQMDALQDAAAISLLVLSPEYLASEKCQHEMRRALQADADFRSGRVLPVIRAACPLPAEIASADPLHVSLIDDGDAAPWDKLLQACGVDIGTTAPAWLQARNELRRMLRRGQSANLVVAGAARWRPLIARIGSDLSAAGRPIAIVDLEKGSTVPRRGLIAEMLSALTGAAVPVPCEPDDLAEFDRVLAARPFSCLAIRHFDLVAHRPHYGVDLFSTLRHHLMETRRLVLLVHSRQPLAALLPRDHPLSTIDLQTVELRGR
jgi:hypothetical protein